MGESMTNHDNPLPDGQKPLNEAQPWTATINHQITNNSDIYKYFMSPTITTLNESISAWMRQATCIDVVIPKIAVDMSPITTHAKMIADIIKPDYTNMVAGLAEISKVSLATQAQAIADIIKPDYTDIFANLSEFSTISMATQAKMIADIIKPDRNAMFANMQIPSMVTQYPDLTAVLPIVQNSIEKFNTGILDICTTQMSSMQQSVATSLRSLRSQLFYTNRNLPHTCEDILLRIHPAVLDAYLGIFSSFERIEPDRAAKIIFSIRRVIDIASKVIVGNVQKNYVKKLLREKNRWNDRCYFGKNGPNLYLRLVYISVVYNDVHLTQNTIDKIMDFHDTLGALHDIIVNVNDGVLLGYIDTLQAIICENIVHWLNLGPITPSC
jgi:hypothetical protein